MERVVSIDATRPVSRQTEDQVQQTRMAVEMLIQSEAKLTSKRSPKTYTWDEAMTKLIEGYEGLHGDGVITTAAVESLLRRAVKPVDAEEGNEQRYVFTADSRHLVPPAFSYPPEVWNAFSAEVACPHLMVMATERSVWYTEGKFPSSVLSQLCTYYILSSSMQRSWRNCLLFTRRLIRCIASAMQKGSTTSTSTLRGSCTRTLKNFWRTLRSNRESLCIWTNKTDTRFGFGAEQIYF